MPLDRRSRQSFDALVDRRGQRGRSCLRGRNTMALPPGTGMMVVGPFDKPMALFNMGGEVFAINAVCPHRGGPLANGRLDGYIVACRMAWLDLRCLRTGQPDHGGGYCRDRLRGDGGAARHLRGLDQAVIRSPWAREYARTPTTYIWGTEASVLARQVSALLSPGARVLDLGCGEGRDSVFFAERGVDVTGVDIARSGLSKAERLACVRGVRVRWVRGDIGGLGTRRVVDGRFDLICSCGAIHYVPRTVRDRLVRRLKALTREHGLHAHIVFTDRAVYVEKGERIDYFASGELAGLYADWPVLGRAQRVIDCGQDGTIHRHSVEQFVARARRSQEDCRGTDQPDAGRLDSV